VYAPIKRVAYKYAIGESTLWAQQYTLPFQIDLQTCLTCIHYSILAPLLRMVYQLTHLHGAKGTQSGSNLNLQRHHDLE
jgi:hypothetical protein